MEPYSVLMSTYQRDHPGHLRDGVRSMLAQTAPPGDYVIVCDGPLTPELDGIVRAFEQERPELFQVIRLPRNVGLGRALSEGLRHCRYDLVARMDGEDLSRPIRCEAELAVFEQRPWLDIVSTAVGEFDDDPEKLLSVRALPEDFAAIRRFSKRRSPFNHASAMFRKSAVLRAGGYRHMPDFEDYDLWARMLLAGSTGYNLPQPLYLARAGRDLSARRGGARYVASVWRFRWSLRRMRFLTWGQFFFTAVGQSAVCLLPRAWRALVYRKYLRREAHG